MDAGVMAFVGKVLPHLEAEGQLVLEVGSRDVNGSVRSLFAGIDLVDYIGVDIEPGPGVDVVLSVHDLGAEFGRGSVDLVICTEVLEHIGDWRSAISAMKDVVRERGSIILTTRHWGFPYHGYPHDYWRFEVIDLQDIFSDFVIRCAESGPNKGAYIWAVKPPSYRSNDLRALEMRPIGNYGKTA